MTKNEAREQLGFESDPAGDVYFSEIQAGLAAPGKGDADDRGEGSPAMAVTDDRPGGEGVAGPGGQGVGLLEALDERLGLQERAILLVGLASRRITTAEVATAVPSADFPSGLQESLQVTQGDPAVEHRLRHRPFRKQIETSGITGASVELGRW